MRKTIGLFAGVITGALVGSVTALLLTPYSGSEIRERLQSGIQHLIEEGKRAAAAQRADMEAQLDAFKRGTPIVLETTPEEPPA